MINLEKLITAGREAGLFAVGACSAQPFTDTKRILDERKKAGLHGNMQFTYRNPERSTEPARLLPDAKTLVVGALDYYLPESQTRTSSCISDPSGRQKSGDTQESDRQSYGFGNGAGGGRKRSGDAQELWDEQEPQARVAAYAQADYYTALRQGLEKIASILRATGYRAVVSADENSLVDRAVAHRAGIGWWGKSASILVPGAGSMVVLGAVVTNALVDYEKPDFLPDGCGPCRRCLDGCPTGAIVAPGVVDARKCLAWLLQLDGVFDPRFRVALGDRIYGCDDCTEVCPPNRVRFSRARRVSHQVQLRRSSEMKTSERKDNKQPQKDAQEPFLGNSLISGHRTESFSQQATQDADCPPPRPRNIHRTKSFSRQATQELFLENTSRVSVLGLLEASDAELMADYGRWYIPKRQARYLRRNALVVLGNVGDPSQPRVRAAVERALSDTDPLIVAHAIWCARRLELPFDVVGLKDDPIVAAEIERDVPQRADLL
ncbi:MAG: hypothetical protein OXI96_07595 [Acidimicrobiaceae bacterium]|nr:hypothetical protein [Acidimicrobiaceae bacterium]